MKIEHKEIIQTMARVERRCDELDRENMYLKSIVETRPSQAPPIMSFVQEREYSTTEDQDTTSEIEAKAYIGDNAPSNHFSLENRCMLFQPNQKLVNIQSSDDLDISYISSQKESYPSQMKPKRKRFLIPQPESRNTADFKHISQD